MEVCCDGVVHPNVEDFTGCCGTEPYNRNSLTCCRGHNGDRTLYSEVGLCCGSHGVYDPNTELCCYSYLDGTTKVHQSPTVEHHRCCGSEFYDVRNQTCCNENIFGGIHECCGSVAFDASKELCCAESIHQKTENVTSCCMDVPYNPETSTCCLGALFEIAGRSCCGGEPFDLSTSSCCNSAVSYDFPTVPGVQSCCGSRSYLPWEQICCNGELFDRDEHTECCGSAAYDPGHQLCCGDWIDTVVLERRSHQTSCCGQTTYEEGIESCCPRTSQVFLGADRHCCMIEAGQELAYDPNSGICCSSFFHESFYAGYSTYTHDCCGTHLLRGDELCDWMNQVPIVKSSYEDDTVCSGQSPEESVTYNSISTICLHGFLIPMDTSVSICGNQIMEEATEICCGDVFIHSKYDANDNERRCCGVSLAAYSPSVEICCSGMVYSIPESQGDCCEYRAYRTSEEVCEDSGVIRPVGKPLRCGNQFYSEDEQGCCGDADLFGPGWTCCDGELYDTGTEALNGGQCCDGVGYDPATQICCGSKLHEEQSRDVECCGDEIFPTDRQRHHICCDGVEQSTRGGRRSCQGSVSFNPKRETVCGTVIYPVSNGICCGDALLNEEAELCCENQIILKNTSDSLSCCGSEIYSSDDPRLVCCHGVLHRESEGRHCCGPRTYDPATQTCCEDDLTQFIYSRRDRHQCCGVLLYNTTRHQCCEGRLHYFEAGSQCCDSEIVPDVDSICCHGNIVERSHGESTECCGQVSYDGSSQLCLHGEVVPKTERDTRSYYMECFPGESNCCDGRLLDEASESCCGGVSVFNRMEQTCCGGYLYPIQNGACCGPENRPFHPESQLCCDGVVKGKTERSRASCCGNTIFSENEEICCQGKLHRALPGVTSCCGEDVYDIDDEICCNNQIYETAQSPEECRRSLSWSTSGRNVSCMEFPTDVTSGDLADMLRRYPSVVVLTPPTLRRRKSGDVCKARVTKVLKRIPSSILHLKIKGSSISFGSGCPCSGNGKIAVLFTNQSIAEGRVNLSSQDALMEMNKKLRRVLAQITQG
ncbi:uncharacterized protein [Apostichopus japonicus]